MYTQSSNFSTALNFQPEDNDYDELEKQISDLLLKMNLEQENSKEFEISSIPYHRSERKNKSAQIVPSFYSSSPLYTNSTYNNSFQNMSQTTTYSDNSTFSDSSFSFNNSIRSNSFDYTNNQQQNVNFIPSSFPYITQDTFFNNNCHYPQKHSNKKNYNKNNNTINLENIIRGLDTRTTIMIRNIPNKYTQKTFTDEINLRFKNKYDVFYLPIDYANNCNLGFAFINFIHPFHIVEFYETYRGQKWMRFLSDKKCELAYGTIQGKQTLIKHFEKGVVLNSQTNDKKPLILNIPNQHPQIKLNIKYKQLFESIYPYWKYFIDYTNECILFDDFYY